MFDTQKPKFDLGKNHCGRWKC